MRHDELASAALLETTGKMEPVKADAAKTEGTGAQPEAPDAGEKSAKPKKPAKARKAKKAEKFAKAARKHRSQHHVLRSLFARKNRTHKKDEDAK